MGGRRAPLIAAGAVALVVIVLLLFLVLPKMGEVSAARDELDQVKGEQATLQSRQGALEDVKAQAPENRATIAEFQRKIPPVADEGGLILLLENAATKAGIDVLTIAPSPPVFDPATGLSTIPVAVSASGNYFDVTQFMFQIETLPRAAKVTSLSLAPAGATSGSPLLTVTTAIELYTSDASAGPGSVPGPTEPTGQEA